MADIERDKEILEGMERLGRLEQLFAKEEARRKAAGEEHPQKKFYEMLDRYHEKFGTSPPTEPDFLTDEEWCEIMEECIKKGITAEELLGIEYEDDWDY